MLYPTIDELTKGKFNRYELAIATAKCARMITDEYVKQRETAEKMMTGNKDNDRPLMAMIDKEYRDEKAVKNAITRINSGEYVIVEAKEEEELTVKDEEAATEEASEEESAETSL